MLDPTTASPNMVTIAGLEIELVRRGQGTPLIFLHPEIGLARGEPVLDTLARAFDVVAPSHPGFGHSQLPEWMTSIDDLAYFYLELMEQLGLDDVMLVGAAFGGWLAVEIAVKQPSRIARLLLANPAGIKLGGREQRDMADIFSLPQKQLDAMSYHDASNARHFVAKSSDEDEIYVELRNRESAARFAWSPYMYNPKLIHRLHLIRVPTLVLWGESDRIASADYGRQYAQRIPGARFTVIPEAGRYPHVERPEAFAEAVRDFAGVPRHDGHS